MGPQVRLAITVAVLALGVAGCGDVEDLAAPVCPRIGDTFEESVVATGTALMVQSLPDASRFPCIESLRPGWVVTELDIESGRSRLTLSSDRLGSTFLTVELLPDCGPPQGTRTGVRDDEAGTELWQAVQEERRGRDREGHYKGSWVYLFDGGCTRFVFDAEGPEVDEIEDDVRDSFAFFVREPLDELIERELGIEP